MADKREIIVDLLARDKSGPATKGFARNLDDAGKSADKTGGRMGKLDDEIGKVESELVKLAKAFTDSNDAAERIDLTKSIRKSQGELRKLNTNRNILKDLIPDPSPADVQSLSKRLSTSISTAVSEISPAAIGGGVLGAAFAPTIGAAVAGAVVGGIGIGGIIGGVALAARDPQIKAQAGTVGKTFLDGVTKEANHAFNVPLKNVLNDLNGFVAQNVPKIGEIFDRTAPSLGTFTDHIEGAASALLDSFVNAADKSGPAIEAIGSLIEDTGGSIGDFISGLADHADEGASAINDISDALQNMITVTSAVVNGLATIKGGFDNLDRIGDALRYTMEDLVPGLDLTADGFQVGSEKAMEYRQGLREAGDGASDMIRHVDNAATSTATLTDKMTDAERAAHGERSALDELSTALKAQADPVFALLDAQDKLKTAQHAVAESTKEHGAKSRETKKALRELAEAALDVEGKAGALGDTFNGKLTPEMSATLRAAGLTKGEISALGGQFATAKRKGDSFAKRYKASVALTGYEAATAHAKEVRDMLAQVRSKKVSVTVLVRTSQLDKAENTLDRLGARAGGGPVSKNVPYWVGENGPEIVVPDSNARVLTAAASRNLPTSGTGARTTTAGGGAVRGVQIYLQGEQRIVEMFRYLIRSANLLQDA